MDVVAILLLLQTAMGIASGMQELKLLHVIITHKLFAPLQNPIGGLSETAVFPKNLTYEHFHSDTLDIPNAAKLRLYELGVHLRSVYDSFLGEDYKPDNVQVRTTEYPLSILAAQLVNAGLWPPSKLQTWNEDFPWQPIPSEYTSIHSDNLLLGILCPNFKTEMEEVLKVEEVQTRLIYHRPLFRHIHEYTGLQVSTPSHIALLYSALEAIVARGASPPAWADGIFPDGEMYNVTLLEYDLLSWTPLQRQLNGGVLLKEIILNSVNRNRSSEEGKLFVYSGDERNVVGVLQALGIWSPHMPDETTTLIFETYVDNETDTQGVKIKYYMGVDGDTLTLQLPRCPEICPLETFADIAFDSIPKNEGLLCGWHAADKDLDQSSTGEKRGNLALLLIPLFLGTLRS